MKGRPDSLWKRIKRHFTVPTFADFLADSAEELRSKPILMTCPACGRQAPLAERCPHCGSPRHRPVDRRV